MAFCGAIMMSQPGRTERCCFDFAFDAVPGTKQMACRRSAPWASATPSSAASTGSPTSSGVATWGRSTWNRSRRSSEYPEDRQKSSGKYRGLLQVALLGAQALRKNNRRSQVPVFDSFRLSWENLEQSYDAGAATTMAGGSLKVTGAFTRSKTGRPNPSKTIRTSRSRSSSP